MSSPSFAHTKRSSTEVDPTVSRGSPDHKRRELANGQHEPGHSQQPTKPAAAPTLDAVDLLLDEHRQIKALFEEFRSLREEDEDDQRRLCHEIIRMLCVHSGVEDQVLVPELRKLSHHSRQNRDIDHAAQEHQQVEDLLFELASLDPEDVRFEMKMSTMMQDVEDHIRHEERDLLPMLRDGLSREQLMELGTRLQEARATAPTQPTHPSTRAEQGPLLPESPPKQHHHGHQSHAGGQAHTSAY